MISKIAKNLRKDPQLIYSVAVVLLIPAALVFNTIWVLRSINRDINFELRNKAVLVGEVIGNMSVDQLEKPEIIGQKIEKIKTDEPEIKNITVLKPATDKGFTSIASTSQFGQAATDPVLSQLVWASNVAHAAIVNDRDTNQSVWSVIVPVSTSDNQKTALIDIKVSTTEVDKVITRTVRDSLIVLVITVVIVLLLLINHLRFFEYARLFRQLREVDKMKDDFISMASHELRTPLTAIKGFAVLLLKNAQVSADSKLKRHVEIIDQSADRLSELVEDLLIVSRIEQNRLAYDIKPIRLDTVIDAIVAELKVQANQKNLKLEFTPLPNQPSVLADVDRLKQIFINIVGNAIKYTDQGKIKIYQQLEDRSLKTFVKDTGVGMSPEARVRLFEKFYRIKNDKTSNIPGTGLGLWITKQIVERMKGEIFVDSIENQGTQVAVVFPALSTKQAAVKT